MIKWFDTDGNKRCCTCKQYKPVTEFHKDATGIGGATYSCKLCANARSRANHKERLVSQEGYKEAKADAYMLSRWGITREEYYKKLMEQGACAICGVKRASNWHLDHCHTTGKTREFLCGNCNRGLGQFQDNEEIMMKAIQYLRKHRESVDLPMEGRRP